MAEEKTSCVLRLFGAPQGQLAGAVGQFAPQWKTQAQWKSRGGETLLALQAASPSGLKKAAQSLQAQFEADLYGAGDTSLAAAVVNALETHDRLLVCSDAAAGALLEARLETVPGAEKVFDFGALSYAHPKAGPQIEKRARARFKAEEPDAVRLALARAQAARRVVGSELAAVWYQYAMGGDWAKLAQLPQRIQTQGLDALKNFWQAYQPKPGTELV